ncbi:ABC-2 family transporter protein [Paenibacillus sp. JX-17]|uniref:ABC-2 family transporter protein n=1 Tax=Paenibacillus lacisoli TaxID=3064525 RepID=A0ABT9CHS9_9BACL|nr:ABC-2 family transporter protein [Paenibacillus sp. JX-17]MDO7908839.1 ABC-2 family transporter protein [Paenibacillus sp. JX-17]
MLYFTLASKAYARNLQYRGAHLVHNLASALFGYMYACIWIGLGQNHSLGVYGTEGMVGYIAFTQASLWISGFVTNGLGIPQTVRTGQISFDLMRPVHLFAQLMAREWGQIAYQFVFKTIPIYLLYYFVFSLSLPDQGSTVLFAFTGLAGAAFLSICMNYIIGASALWTTESSWLYWGNHAMINLLAGFFIPIEWLPDWLEKVAWWSPYPYLLYVPTRIYLGFESVSLLWGTLFWCVVMILVCLTVTRLVRHKVEVQGG